MSDALSRWLTYIAACSQPGTTEQATVGACFYDDDGGNYYRVEKVTPDGIAVVTVVALNSTKRTTAMCNARLLALTCERISAYEFPYLGTPSP